MLHRRFLLREIWQGRRQALIFIFCVALSLATTVALNGFRRDIDRSITGDARACTAATSSSIPTTSCRRACGRRSTACTAGKIAAPSIPMASIR